jgi:hypothetical protein
MVPASHHVGIEADNAGTEFPADILEMRKESLPVPDHAPGSVDFTGL